MHCKTTIPRKSLRTITKFIWFLSSMCLYMAYKMSILWKCLFTLDTLIWFLPSVCLLMFCKMTFLFERLFAITTLIWFFNIVCSQMAYEDTIFCESLTVAAFVCFLLIGLFDDQLRPICIVNFAITLYKYIFSVLCVTDNE